MVTKYNSTDGKTKLDASDEAVIASWGNGWRMPTIGELYSLYYANGTWVNNYNNSGINGYLFTDDNDSSKCMFLPAAGGVFIGSVGNVNERCSYWSSELSNSYESCAKCISLSSSATQSDFYVDTLTRHYGYSIRPIFDENATIIPNKTATVSVTGSYNDLSDKPTIPTIPTIPTKTSDLTNDSGYIPKPNLNANGHTYVDLDLPSGTLWATTNIGASSETDSGLYFQWGDTQGYNASQIGDEPG